mgnify:FL=1
MPFLFSALAVGLSASALVYVERLQPPSQPIVADAQPARVGAAGRRGWAWLLLLVLLLAFGQQVHTAINAAAQFRRLADPEVLPWLLPVFWVGFSFGLLLVDRLVRARGTLWVLQLACVAGALTLSVAAIAVSLPLLVLSQFVAGFFWGFILCALIGFAVERGQPLRTGRHTGMLMATLAVAAMSRLGLTASGAVAAGSLLEWLPVIVWGLVAVFLVRRGASSE